MTTNAMLGAGNAGQNGCALAEQLHGRTRKKRLSKRLADAKGAPSERPIQNPFHWNVSLPQRAQHVP